LWKKTMRMGGCWLLEVDIRKFFDTLDFEHLRNLLDLRVRDGVLRRLIHKWLHAGVMEDGSLSHPDAGTPQGGVISPLLANVYLHEVLDKWFVSEVKPRLRGEAFLVRYADDFVIGFKQEEDARRVMAVLPKRFGRFGLTLHPTKTRLVDYRRPRRPTGPSCTDSGEAGATFDFLGFTHLWAKSQRGYMVVTRRTARSRFKRAVVGIYEWCRKNRHWRVEDQAKALAKKLVGHYGYYGITGNYVALSRYLHAVTRCWHKWLDRRSENRHLPWSLFKKLLGRYPLPPPRIVHSAMRPQQLELPFDSRSEALA
jgi:group II intron reverse transcriptase/maturase